MTRKARRLKQAPGHIRTNQLYRQQVQKDRKKYNPERDRRKGKNPGDEFDE